MWNLLSFAMQMCLVLVTGHALAESPPVARFIRFLSHASQTPAQAAVLVALTAGLAAIINWGLGLIVGALLAREVGRVMEERGERVHYPLLAAAGYFGLMVWHGGLSGSAPLTVTTVDEMAKVIGADMAAQVGPMPLQTTIGSWHNLVITGGLLVFCPLLFGLLHPKRPSDIELYSDFRQGELPTLPPPTSPDELEQHVHLDDKPSNLPEWLGRRPALAWLFAIALAAGLSRMVARVDGISNIGLNEINLAMLILGLAMHGSIDRYVAAVDTAVRGCGGIILQFPLYAGIMGMMKETGLGEQIAQAIVSRTTADTLPLFTFFSAGVVNLFVPSGGGQFAVQGPIILEGAVAAQIEPAKMVMAMSYGDQLTNMLQPFWALPLLAITGVRARDIVGYTAIVMVAGATWIGVCLWVL
jgi:short-chain fatty acids transporter